LQRKFETGPSGEASFVLVRVSNRPDPGGAEQSSSSVKIAMNRKASSRRNPWFSTGAGRPSAPSARVIDASTCSNPHPCSPSAAMQLKTSGRLPV